MERFSALADAGVDLALVDLPDPFDGAVCDFLADLIGQVHNVGRPTPGQLLGEAGRDLRAAPRAPAA